MSLFTLAQTDKAHWAFNLESSISNSYWGFRNGVASVTTTGSPTFVSANTPSGGAGYYSFNGSDGIQYNETSRTNSPVNSTDACVEAVFRTTHAAASGDFRIIYNNSNNIRLGITDEGKLNLSVNSSVPRTVTTSITVNDGVWHHVMAVPINSYQHKIFIDGVDRGTTSPNSSYSSTPTTSSYIGYHPNSYQKFIGDIDFVAHYAGYNVGGYVTPTTSTVDAHFAEYSLFTGASISVDESTASSLFVHPVISAQKNINVSADPSTASSLFVDPKVSNFDYPKTLLTYINSIDPEYYIRFKDINFGNEISGTAYTGWAINGSPVFKQISGVSTEPSIYLDNVPGSQFLRGEFRPNNPGGNLSDFATYFRDDDVSVGFWLKTTTANVTIFEAFELDIGNTWQPLNPFNYLLTLNADGKPKIEVGLVDTNDDPVYHSITSATAVTNGQWHFISFRFSGNILKLYVDGTLAGTETGIASTGTSRTLNSINFGGYSDTEWASMVLGPYSLLTDAINTDIWNIGTANFQARSQMVDPVVTISTGFYDKVNTLAPILNYKFDGSLTPVSTVNNNYATLLTASTFNSSNVSYGYPAKNVNAYRVQDTTSNWNGIWETPSGTFTTDNEWSLSALVKVDSTKVGGTGGYYGANRQFAIISGNGFGDIALGYSNTKWLAYASEEFYATELTIQSTSNIDSNWHLLTATFDGTYFKLYVDGKEQASQDTSTYYADTPYKTVDSGQIYIGGGENFYFQMGSTTDVDKIIDHVALYDFSLSATQAFELWQSVGIDPMVASNATFPLPVGVAGFGPTIHPGVMYVSALLVDPTQQDTVAPTILPMTAFATSVTPNFAATSTATIAADPATASALFHMPQFNIGENNSVDHMNASAVFMDPDVLIPGFWNANPMIATTGTFVNPAVVTTQGGLVLAQVMTASGSFVLPPTYKSLFDDKWYDLLYSQHSIRHNFTTPNGGNGEAILKLFDDVTTDKAGGSTIPNNLTQTITTDGAVIGNTAPALNIVSEFTPTTNTPLLGIGYFDDYERKAVKFNNITTGYENSEYITTAFSFELSIKTTKENQIIAFGKTRSFYGYQQYTTSYGLSDGKLFLRSTGAIGPAPTLHYKETTSGNVLIGNKNIADGQWHHIVIQNGWDDNRVQFWIDGELDKQKIGGFRLNGPSFLGFNSQVSTYASDFQTSAWSYDSHAFPRELEIDNHRYAYIKYEPVRAEPMIASATSGDHLAAGNRARALMLYWWPSDPFQSPSLLQQTFNKEDNGGETFTTELSTADFIKSGPQDYYGWDVFPVDITGYFVSDLVKPEAYGGKENIKVGSKAFIGTGQNYRTNPEYLYNQNGSFRDPNTDARRYIDLINDIDLRNFDAIFFKNFPDESKERDEFATTQSVDTYFGSQEAELYDAFIKSLRAAVDTGVSLYITNPQLATDLGIVDRIETVPDMDDLVGSDSDPYTPTLVEGDAALLTTANAAHWADTYKNNRLRVVNTLEGFTTEPSLIRTDRAYYYNDDANDFGAPNRPFTRFVYRTNGLQIGDEFIISNDPQNPLGYSNARTYLATPFANVKSGKVITAFANTVKRGLDTITNPYKDYATCIVVEPGDELKGTQCGGKIVVNFTENLNGAYDNGDVDMITDFWINLAYDNGEIDLATKNIYLNASYNLDRKLQNGSITQDEYNKLTFWSSNGMNIVTDAKIIDDPTQPQPKSGLGKGQRTETVIKTRKSGTAYTAKVTTSAQWFTFAYAWRYPRLTIKVPTILTRGFWWLSNRESYDGAVQRPLVATASAIFVDPVATGQKDRSVNAPALIASATIVQSIGTSAASVNVAPLPFQATALMNNYVTRYTATPMTASAVLRTNSRVFTTAVDEVVVYIYHTDPILYLREDVIK
jgi:hypothetical protein